MSEMEMLKELHQIVAIVAGQDLAAERATGTIVQAKDQVAKSWSPWSRRGSPATSPRRRLGLDRRALHLQFWGIQNGIRGDGGRVRRPESARKPAESWAAPIDVST